MPDSVATLRTLLPEQGRRLSEDAVLSLSASAPFQLLKTSLDVKLGAASWGDSMRGIQESVASLFDVKLLDVLGGAWNKARAIQQRLEESKAKPTETFSVVLNEHTIKSVHKPYVEVLVDRVSTAKIEFDVTLSLKIEGAKLKIQAGRVTSVEAGSCKGTIKVKLGDAVLLEKDAGIVPIAGAFSV